MARNWPWPKTISIALAIAVVIGAATSGAEAQRRRGRRGARARTHETTEATDAGTAAEPPEDPFADSAGAAGAEATAGAEAAAGTTTTTTTTTTAPTTSTTTSTSTSTTTTTSTSTTTPGAGGTAPAAQRPQVAEGGASADQGPLPPDLSALRQEYVAIMDEMVQARSRVAIVGQELFQTRMTIQVQDRTGDEETLSRFVVELDGTPVYHSDGEIEGGAQGRQVFEGAVAPGPHVLTIDLEARARDDTEYRTEQRESFRFVVVRDRLSEITVVLEDDTDIARSFRSGGEGHFEVRTNVRVATRALPRS